MRNGKAVIWAVLALLLTGYSWENPSSTGDTVSPGGSEPVVAAPRPQTEAKTGIPVTYEEAPEPTEVVAPESVPAEEETVAAPAEERVAESGSQNLASAKLFLYVNDAKNQAVYRGWPLFVKVSVENPGPGEITLDPGAAGWTRFVDLEVKDEKGRLHDWPFRLASAAKPGRTVRLAAGEAAALIFLVAGQDMRARSGNYTLDASVGGAVRTERGVVIGVKDHPESLTEEQESYRGKLSALYDLFTGKKPNDPRVQAPPPQVVYVQTAPAPRENGGGEAIAGILGLVSEFGMQGALPTMGADYSDYGAAEYTDDSSYENEAEYTSDESSNGEFNDYTPE